MSVLAAGYLPVWLLVCLSGGLLDRLSVHLAASGSGSGRISICLAICLLIGLFWRLFILLLILVPILLVCQFGHLQVCSVACRLQFRPFACSTGQVPIRLFICQSWQAMSQFWQSVCSFSCNWQHLAAFPFICRIHHLQAEVSSIHLPFRQAVEVHLPNLAGRGPFRSSNPSAIQAGCRPFRPKRGPIRPIYTSIHQQTHRLSRLTDSPFLHHCQANCQSVLSPYILASQALQIPHICFITSLSPSDL